MNIKKFLRILGLVTLTLVSVALFIVVYFNFINPSQPDPATVYGVSYNSEYARYLGLDDKKTFTALLDDWHFHYIRLSAQWSTVESKRGNYDFSELDWLMNEAAKHHAQVVIAVGQKTPRWPECHIPAWTTLLSSAAYDQALRHYIGLVVQRYKNNPALEMWQVENEPFLDFGVCPPFTEAQLGQEIALVRSLDPSHPTLTSDSGELSMWWDTGHAADYFGTTLYRVVWNRTFGYMNYNWIPAEVYKFKFWLARIERARAFVMELQAEPWIASKPFSEVPLSEQYKSMNLLQLQKNVVFAAELGVPRAYLWGGEWWYYLRQHGENAIPDYITNLKKQ